jgi:putative resolvase
MLPDTHSYLEDQKVSIGDAARITGVSISTLRRWERQGLIEPSRTLGGQRRYSVQSLKRLQPEGHKRSA